MRWALGVVTIVAGCGGPASSGPGTSSTGTVSKPPEPPPKPVCITPPEEIATIRNATSDGSQVQYCIADKECFAVDLGSGAYHRLVEPPRKPASSARVEAVTPKLEICNGDSCTSLTSKVIPGTATMRAATNRDGTYAVVLLGDAPRGRGYAEVWNVAKTKKAAMFRYARGDYRCGEVAMLDNTIYLSAAHCGQPAARAGLYRLDGRKIANVGGKDFGTYGSAHVHVEGSTWAFLEESANRLVLQDVVKGKVLKRIDTAQLFDSGGAKMGTPGESALVRLADGRLVVIAGSPATGSVATIDPASGEISVIPAPVCSRSGV